MIRLYIEFVGWVDERNPTPITRIIKYLHQIVKCIEEFIQDCLLKVCRLG